jgi:RNA polymerase subunit RPABC4/transcription elongation factor Spt4
MKTPEEMNWFLRGGKRPDPAPKAPVVVCQNCGGDNLADEEQCTHCGTPLQGGITAAEYHDFLRGLVTPSDEPATGDRTKECPGNPAVEFVMEKLASHRARPTIIGPSGDGVGNKVCPECGHWWPSDTEYCPMCHSTLRAPNQKTYLVKVSQVKRCLWEGYVEIIADSQLEAISKARDEYDNCGLDTWDLVDPDLGSDDDEEPVFRIAEPEA